MKSAARDLTKYMIAHGYTVDVDDGGDDLALTGSTSINAIMRAVHEVEDCTLTFHHPNAKSECAYIVLGNDPDEEVADFSIDGMVDQWVDAFLAE
jgi:hypothetical protein